jgi:predicted ArsR family transcriptional regulator
MYERLATLMLEEFCEIDPYQLVGLDASQRTAVALSHLADRVAARYAAVVSGRPLADRVKRVTEILQEESGFAEWRETPDGYEIRDLNCPYRRLVGCAEQVCEWHHRFISQLLDREIAWAPDGCAGVECCRYVVRENEPVAGAASA